MGLFEKDENTRISAARKRLRKGTIYENSNTESQTSSSCDTEEVSNSTGEYSANDYFAEKAEQKRKKAGKGRIITRIFLKSICIFFGLVMIALALLSYFASEGKIPQDQRIGALFGQVASGAFFCGIWLFYYGTIVALKKAGFKVRDDLKDPSFWEVVSVTTVTTTYSDGSTEKKTYSDIRGSFFGEIIIFLLIFTLIQTYYFVASPILAFVSLGRDIKTLKNEQ